MKKFTLALGIAALVGAGCISITDPGAQPSASPDAGTAADAPVTETGLNNLFKTTCEETGGIFSVESATCACADEATLDQDSGECLTADGTPDGIRGEEMRARYELMVACKETAGTYDDEDALCTCPEADTLEDESGECRTAVGLPDGIRGQEAKELLFKTNCQNSGGVHNSEDSTCTCEHGNVADDGACPAAPTVETDTGAIP